jgi:hypothetical protein
LSGTRQCYEPRDIVRPDISIHEREIAKKSVGEKHPEGVGRALTLRVEVSEGPSGARLLPRAVDVRVVSERDSLLSKARIEKT